MILSIGLPVYNSALYVQDVLNSLLNQSFRDFELIISDDASTDDTYKICFSYAQKDSRIRIFRQEKNIGMTANQNFLLKAAKGEYFMWTAHDDVYAKDFISLLLKELESDKDLVSVFSPFAFFTENIDQYGRIYSNDYNNRFAFLRLCKFCIHSSDAFFYGIHRSAVLKKISVPTWWRKNAMTPANSNYPVVLYILAAGNYKLVGEQPVFFKRIKTPGYPLNPDAGGIRALMYFGLRKANLFLVSVTYIYKGCESVLLTFFMVFPVIAWALKDVLVSIYYFFKDRKFNRLHPH